MTADLSKHCFRREDYVVSRQRRDDGTEWVRSRAPLRSWVKDTAIAIGFIAAIVAFMWMLGNLATWCQALGVCS